MEGGEKIVEQFHTILKLIKLIKISENETQLDTWIQSVRNRIVESRVLRILLDAWFDIGTYAWPSLAEHAGNPLTARCRELLPRVTWAQSNFEPKRPVHRPPSKRTTRSVHHVCAKLALKVNPFRDISPVEYTRPAIYPLCIASHWSRPLFRRNFGEATTTTPHPRVQLNAFFPFLDIFERYKVCYFDDG